ncbi:hypothetical protein C4A76_25980 [Brevibacillus laterosporus]|nr:hypothetical protein C4A76_25980 [Brevibacillus laterosporus]
MGYDTETGEKVIRQEVWLKNKQIAKVIDVHNRKNTKHAKFQTSRRQKRILPQLLDSELALLCRLLPYMCWETNLVVGDGELGKKNEPLSWAKIDSILPGSKPLRIKVAKSLVKKNVIGYHVVDGKRTGIVINPCYAINGYKPAEYLYKLFALDNNSLDEEEDDP